MSFIFTQDTLLNNLHIETPDDFIKYVSLDSQIKEILFNTKNIFRGVADEQYELIPSSRREGVNLSDLAFPSEAEHFDNNSLLGQIANEYLVLKNFFEFADKSGLRVPECPLLRQTLRNKIAESAALDSWSEWPSEEIVPLVALAQHFGIPTCMLDWTYSFPVALYFATYGAINMLDQMENCNNKRFAIYILNIKSLDKLKLRSPANWPLYIAHPPYHENTNLSAQTGLLSFWQEKIPSYSKITVTKRQHTVSIDPLDKPVVPIDRKPVNQKLSDFTKKLNLPDEDFITRLMNSLFYKITISYKCIEKALLYLSSVNTNASSLFPGFVGVVRHMQEMATIRKNARKIFTLTASNQTTETD